MSEGFKPITPADVLADGVDSGVMNNTSVRKGTIKALIDNIKALESVSLESEDRDAIVPRSSPRAAL